MGLLQRLFARGDPAGDPPQNLQGTGTLGGFPQRSERRSTTPTSWDLMRSDQWQSESGSPVSPYIAENLSAVFACVQIISETVAALPPVVYRREGDGMKFAASNHPVARLFARQPNSLQTTPEFLEMMTAHVLLRGNAYAEIVRDARGAPIELIPLHPDWVCLLRIPNTRIVVYDVTDVNGGRTRRLLAEEILHLKDRSDDGICGKSRLHRARETFGTAISTERFAGFTYKNGAMLSGVLMHPELVGEEAIKNLRASFNANYTGVEKARSAMILEEGMKWESVSVSPEDAQMLESRRFSVEQIARLFRVPPPVLGHLADASYNNVTELGIWFHTHTIAPWLVKWERTLERALFSAEAQRSYEIEFDADADVFLSPMNMQSEQTQQPKRPDAAAA